MQTQVSDDADVRNNTHTLPSFPWLLLLWWYCGAALHHPPPVKGTKHNAHTEGAKRVGAQCEGSARRRGGVMDQPSVNDEWASIRGDGPLYPTTKTSPSPRLLQRNIKNEIRKPRGVEIRQKHA